jgi:hypothetical protein
MAGRSVNGGGHVRQRIRRSKRCAANPLAILWRTIARPSAPFSGCGSLMGPVCAAAADAPPITGGALQDPLTAAGGTHTRDPRRPLLPPPSMTMTLTRMSSTGSLTVTSRGRGIDALSMTMSCRPQLPLTCPRSLSYPVVPLSTVPVAPGGVGGGELQRLIERHKVLFAARLRARGKPLAVDSDDPIVVVAVSLYTSIHLLTGNKIADGQSATKRFREPLPPVRSMLRLRFNMSICAAGRTHGRRAVRCAVRGVHDDRCLANVMAL